MINNFSAINIRGLWFKWRALFSNTFFIYLNTIINSLLGFIFWIIAARIYTQSDVGIGATVISSIALLASLGDMGLGTTLIRYLSSVENGRADFFNVSGLIVIISTSIITLLFLFGVYLWSPDLGFLIERSYLFSLFLFVSVGFSLMQFIDRLFIATQASQILVARNFLANLIRICVLILFGKKFGVSGFLLAIGFSVIVTFIISLALFIPKVLAGYKLNVGFNLSLILEKVSYSLSNHLSQVLWNAPPLLYPLIILYILTPEDNSVFYICWMIANVLFILPNALSSSILAFVSNNEKENSNKLVLILLISCSILFPIVIVMFVFSKYILGLFGQEYISSGITLLRILIISIFPYSINSFILVLFRVIEYIRGIVLLSTLIFVFCIVLIIMFASSSGLIGIGKGWVISQSICSLISIYWYLKQTKISSKA